jgi:hypothetical protein
MPCYLRKEILDGCHWTFDLDSQGLLRWWRMERVSRTTNARGDVKLESHKDYKEDRTNRSAM